MKEESNIKENNRYKCLKLLGEGTYGKAFLVECPDYSLSVVKTIFLDQTDDQATKEAYMEAKILEKLDHPNIIKFKEVYISKKPKLTLCIVMDYADGGDLQSKIKQQKMKYFPEHQIIDWFTQICLAIKHIHNKKILHRDIKSANIFLTINGLVKLGDFGIAKCLKSTLEKAKTVVGTPYYLSPEIIQNQPYSFKSDIWSLGVLLYEMCCLKMPFDGNNIANLSLKIIKGQYNPIPSLFSKELRGLIMNILNVDESKRPNIDEILRYNIIKSRIKNFLNEVDYNKEFSNTFLNNDMNQCKTKEKFSHFDLTRNMNLYDKYKLSNKYNQFNKITTEEKKKNIPKRQCNYLNDNNKNSYVNFYKKREINNLKSKERLDDKPVLNQSLTDFLKNQETSNITITDIDSINQDSELFGDTSDDIYYDKNKYHKDYVNAHKILIELDKINEEIQNEDSMNDEVCKKDENNFDLKEVLIDEDLITYEDFDSYEENCDDDEINNDSYNLTNSEIQDLHLRIQKEEKVEYDFSMIESSKIELENYLGEDIFSKLYEIIEEYYENVNAGNFNIEILKQIITKEFYLVYSDDIIINCINKIPEIFSLIAKEKLVSLYNR